LGTEDVEQAALLTELRHRDFRRCQFQFRLIPAIAIHRTVLKANALSQEFVIAIAECDVENYRLCRVAVAGIERGFGSEGGACNTPSTFRRVFPCSIRPFRKHIIFIEGNQDVEIAPTSIHGLALDKSADLLVIEIEVSSAIH